MMLELDVWVDIECRNQWWCPMVSMEAFKTHSLREVSRPLASFRPTNLYCDEKKYRVVLRAPSGDRSRFLPSINTQQSLRLFICAEQQMFGKTLDTLQQTSPSPIVPAGNTAPHVNLKEHVPKVNTHKGD